MADRRVDTGNPQTAERALAKLAVYGCQALSAVDRLGRLTELLAAGTTKTLG